MAQEGGIQIDTNADERALRPIAVGRKNWLFAGSERGGRAAAIFFTLLESARRNGALDVLLFSRKLRLLLRLKGERGRARGTRPGYPTPPYSPSPEGAEGAPIVGTADARRHTPIKEETVLGAAHRGPDAVASGWLQPDSESRGDAPLDLTPEELRGDSE